jgi:hypothetical protein
MRPTTYIAPKTSQNIFSRRFIGAALGGIIIAIGCAPERSYAFVEDIYSETEVGGSGYAEDVAIIDSTKQMEDQRPFLDQSQFCSCDLPDKNSLVKQVFVSRNG